MTRDLPSAGALREQMREDLLTGIEVLRGEDLLSTEAGVELAEGEWLSRWREQFDLRLAYGVEERAARPRWWVRVFWWVLEVLWLRDWRRVRWGV